MGIFHVSAFDFLLASLEDDYPWSASDDDSMEYD